MTTVTGAPAAANQAATGVPQRANGLQIGSETFLTLLLAQLKQQDPMKPVESTEFVAQLATLSNLEQASQQTAKLDQVLAVMSLAQAQGLVGRTVTSADGQVSGQVLGARVTAAGVEAVLDGGRRLLIEAGTLVAGA